MNKTISPLKNANVIPAKDKQLIAIYDELAYKGADSAREVEKLRMAGVSGTAGTAGVNSRPENSPQQGAGIFFDFQKGEQYQKLQKIRKNEMARSHSQSKLDGRRKSGLNLNDTERTRGANSYHNNPPFQSNSVLAPFPQNGSKLYSPYEYMQYATKINESRENYLTGLQQLGYQNVDELNSHTYNDIVNRTENIIQSSYCLKYLGVIDGNMGVLSKRVQIRNQPTEKQQKQQSRAQIQSQRKQEAEFRQKKSQGLPIPPLPENISNISMVPSSHRPDLYNSYLITQYSLPKQLKPIVKERDPLILDDKVRLAMWHAEQLKKDSNLLTQDDMIQDKQHQQNLQQINTLSQSNTTLLNSTASLNPNTSSSKLKIKKMRTTHKFKQITQQIDQPSDRTTSTSPLRQASEIIQLNKLKQNGDSTSGSNTAPSFSRLLTNIQQEAKYYNGEDVYQIIPKQNRHTTDKFQKKTTDYGFSKTQLKKQLSLNNPPSQTSIKFTQNEQLQDRFDHIANLLSQKKAKNTLFKIIQTSNLD